MDLILGDGEVRWLLEDGVPIMKLEESWQKGLDDFKRRRRSCFLYELSEEQG